MRYLAIEGSESGHCCFEGTVVDATRNGFTPSGFEVVCECFDLAGAERIAAILNRDEGSKAEEPRDEPG